MIRLLAAFHNGVSSDLFIHKLYDQKTQTMAELIHSAQSFMNAKDVIIAKKRKRIKQMEVELPRHPKQGPRPKKTRTGEKKDRDNRKAGSSSRQSALHALECSTWSSAYADQGWSILEVAREDERRS